MEKEEIATFLLRGGLSPRAAAFLVHAFIEKVPFTNEEEVLKFKRDIKDLFKLTDEL